MAFSSKVALEISLLHHWELVPIHISPTKQTSKAISGVILGTCANFYLGKAHFQNKPSIFLIDILDTLWFS